MKTLSVKQVAEYLGINPRTVLKRLSNGQLKGTRRTNKFGVEEWWVYPNKEIRQALESSGQTDLLSGEDVISDAEVVDSYTENFSPEEAENNESFDASPQDVRSTTQSAADELWNNIIGKFVTELKERDQLIGEMRVEMAEKDRQLRLLPDLQKQAEKERQEAEMKSLEAEALKKQISALQDEVEQRIPREVEKQLQDEKAAKESELANIKTELERERQLKQEEIKMLEERLASVDEYKKLAQEAQARLDELQRKIEERNAAQEAEKTAALEELKRLQEEKRSESTAIREELAALSKKLEKSEGSWWKKLFNWGMGQGET